MNKPALAMASRVRSFSAMIVRLALCVAVLVVGAPKLQQSGATAKSAVHEFRQVHMGVEVRVALAGMDRRAAERLAERAFGLVDELESILSDWRVGSEVRRLAGSAAGEWITISRPLRDVLALSLAVARASDGAFDPTVGPISSLWRESARTGRPIDEAERARVLERVGWRNVELDSTNRRVRLKKPGMQLDFGAIAKGFVLDSVVASLRDSVSGVLAEAGGDIVVSGSSPSERGWRILVPLAGRDTTLVLTGGAVSSSASLSQSVVGVTGREGHLVDARTGRGLGGGAVITVLGPRGALTDAMATALNLLPTDRRDELARRFGVTLVR
ncbi:MAG: FAD:protein FMN transferase [Gemmatimonadota bacterium]